jgi:hypothetical protein
MAKTDRMRARPRHVDDVARAETSSVLAMATLITGMRSAAVTNCRTPNAAGSTPITARG